MDSSASPTKCRNAALSINAKLTHAAQTLMGCSTKTTKFACPTDSAIFKELRARAALLTRCAPLTGVRTMDNATL
jgi:hypothetical protein